MSAVPLLDELPIRAALRPVGAGLVLRKPGRAPTITDAGAGVPPPIELDDPLATPAVTPARRSGPGRSRSLARQPESML